MAQKIITVILALLIIGGLAWYFNKTYLQSSSGIGNEKIPQFKPSTSIENIKSGLVYTTKNEAQEIWQVNFKKESKKLFTDADEAEKMIKISNLAPFSKEVLAITSTDSGSFSGKLVAINLTTAKETVLQKTFALPTAWAISADSQKIVFVKFSNLEENYGYTLYSENRDGSNIRGLLRSDSEIKTPSWNKSATKIAYVKISGTTSVLGIFNIESGETDEIKNFENKNIDWLSWDGDPPAGDKIILSVRNLGDNQKGVIEIIGADGKNLEKIADFEGGIANFIFQESGWLGYLIAQYESDKINNMTKGQIYIENLNGQKIPVQKGNQILGWLPES